MEPLLNLIVLRAANIESSLAFYQTLGLTFVKEQHGAGPVHYSCSMGATVIEIYPGSPGIAPDRKNAGSTALGFQVADVDLMVVQLKADGAVVLNVPKDGTWGRRAVVQDPDGRAVELFSILKEK